MNPDQPTPSAADALREWPRTDAIFNLLQICFGSNTDYEHFVAAKEGARCGVEALESELATALAGRASLDGEIAGLAHELEHVWKPAAAMNEQYARAYQQERDTLRAEVETLRKERDAARNQKRPFSDALAQKVIERQIQELDRLRKALSDERFVRQTIQTTKQGLEAHQQKQREEWRINLDALAAKLAEAKAENTAWLEFFESNTALDDLAIDHPDHESGVSRVVLAADALAKFNVSRRFIRDAMDFAEREETERVSALTSAQNLAGELAGALEKMGCECAARAKDGRGGKCLRCKSLARYRAQQLPMDKEAE